MRLRRPSTWWFALVLFVWLGLGATLAICSVERARARATAEWAARADALRHLVSRYVAEQDQDLARLVALATTALDSSEAFTRLAFTILGEGGRIVSVRLLGLGAQNQFEVGISVPAAAPGASVPPEARFVFGQRLGETGAYVLGGATGRYLLGRRAGVEGNLAVVFEVDATRLVSIEEQPAGTRLVLALNGKTLVDRRLGDATLDASAAQTLSFEGLASRAEPRLQLALARGVTLADLADLADPLPSAAFALGSAFALFALCILPGRAGKRGRDRLPAAAAPAAIEREAAPAEAWRREALGVFANSIVHHLGPPVALIRARAEQVLGLAGEGAQVRAQAALEACLAEARRAEGVLARMQAEIEEAAGHPAPTDINLVVRAAIEQVQGELDAKGVNVSLDLERPLPPALVDAAVLEGLVAGLVRETAGVLAVQGLSRPHIIVWTLDLGESLLIHLSDNGPDTNDGALAALLEPPWVPDAATLQARLPLWAALVAKAGGMVSVEPGAGGGARFAITLPVASGQRLVG